MSLAGRCAARSLAACWAAGFAWSAGAQLPLSIEELLVRERTLQLQSAVSYSNSDTLVPVPASIALGNAAPGFSRRQTRVTSVTSRVRYGVLPGIEINASAVHARADWRQPGLAGGADQSRLALGANWLVSADTRTPALLLSAGVDVFESSWLDPDAQYYGKTARVGATLYRSIDPLVLSLAAGYEVRSARAVAAGQFSPGNLFYLQPQVNFAVNYRVTLTGGVALQIREREKINGAPVSLREHGTALNLGLGVLAGEHSTVFVDTRIGTSGDDSAQLMLEWLYRF